MDKSVPISRTWWIESGRVLGGRYPSGGNFGVATDPLQSLVEAGITDFLSLQEADELGRGGIPFPDYAVKLHSIADQLGVNAKFKRFPIVDAGVPTVPQMTDILEAIQTTIDGGGRVYVHCWGGHGRTATVAGCWLIDHGMTAAEALGAITKARSSDDYLAEKRSPETNAQVEFVKAWADRRR